MYNKIGQIGRDYEEGINFERLRSDRLRKAQEALKRHGLGGMIICRLDNSRYVTGFKGLGVNNSVLRYAVLPVDGDPVLYELGGDYGRAYETAPWLREKLTFSIPIGAAAHRNQPGEIEMRKRLEAQWANGIKNVLQEYGVANKKIGIDYLLDISALRALEEAKIDVVDGAGIMMDARCIKTQDELQLLSIAQQIAEAVLYTIEHAMKPGIREMEIWAEASRVAIALGAEEVLGICTTGGRTNPYYRLEGTDKIMRPGDLLITDVVVSYMGYHTCVVRTFLLGNKATKEQKKLYREAYDNLYSVINAIKPGVTTDKLAEHWPEAGFEAYSLNIAHGLGLSIHETPNISDAYSKACPEEIKENMYMAVETYAGQSGCEDGVRLEENFVVTKTGVELFTRYPFDEKFMD
jgi:Xaa-Pro aminopeptidase